MSETGGNKSSKLIGALAGAAVAIVLIVLGMIVIGIIAGVAVGVVLAGYLGKQDVGAAPAQEEASAAQPVEAAAPVAQEEAAPATKPAPVAEKPAAKWKPSAVLAGEQELASRKGTWRYQGA